MLGNAEQILRESVAGFHQYVLTQPVHLKFVSDGFCALMGLPREQILNGQDDSLSALVRAGRYPSCPFKPIKVAAHVRSCQATCVRPGFGV